MVSKSEPGKCTFGETKATDIVRSLCPSSSKATDRVVGGLLLHDFTR